MSAHHDTHSVIGAQLEGVERLPGSNVWEITRPPLLIVEPTDRDIPLLVPPGRVYLAAKRAFDIVASAILLVCLSPLFLALAIAVRRSSPGRILFVQTRVGKDMKPFQCLKFRTMVEDAETILHENPQLRDAMAVTWKLHEDPRVTKAGRIMRKTSLDELPQFWNVLKGEMSFVGPRPVQYDEIDRKYGAYGPAVMMAKPGITGLWQVSGRSNTTYEERVRLDIKYVTRVCLKTDLMILVRTIPILISRSGAT